jgi:hypothetical protein
MRRGAIAPFIVQNTIITSEAHYFYQPFFIVEVRGHREQQRKTESH